MEETTRMGDYSITKRERDPLMPPFGLTAREWFGYKKDLESKKSVVRSQVKRIAKNGHNKKQDYRYAEAADIYDQINDIMHEARLGFSVDVLGDEVVEAKGGAPITRVKLLVTWTDLETGYFEQQEITGMGLDYGDKGIYKAYTGAAKYALVLNFLIPTGDDPARGAMDPENDRNSTPRDEQRGQQDAPDHQTGTSSAGGRQTGGNGRRGGNVGTNNRNRDEKPAENAPPNDPPPSDEKPAGSEELEPMVTPELIAKIKLGVGRLSSGFKEPKARNTAVKGTYDSLAVKLKLEKLDEKGLVQLTENEGKLAVQYVEAWAERKEKLQAEKDAAADKAAETPNPDVLGGQEETRTDNQEEGTEK